MKQNERNSRKRLNSLILLVAFTAVMLIVSTYAWFSTQKSVTIGGLKGEVKVAEGLQISLDAKTWKNTIDLSSFSTTKDEHGNLKWTSDEYVPGATFQAPYQVGTKKELQLVPNGGKNPGEDGYVEKKEEVDVPVYASNVTPTDLLPVSTTGLTGDGIGETQLNMYWGDLSENIKLSSIKKMPEIAKSGYYAFDIFVQNSSASGVTVDTLQLEPTSTVIVNEGKENTGLQNTVRVGFALYENATDDEDDTNDATVTVNSTPTTAQIIAGASVGKKIKDVAIWEPNSDYHVQTIVDSNNNITWSEADLKAYRFDLDANASAKFKFVSKPVYDDDGTTVKEGFVAKIPTYALSNESRAKVLVADSEGREPGTNEYETTYKQIADKNGVEPGEDDYITTYEYADGGSINDIYDWATPAAGLKKQYTLQTSAEFDASTGNFKGDGMTEEKIDLISIKKSEILNDGDSTNDPMIDDDENPETQKVKDTNTTFDIGAGQYHKIRVYVWLEGQDVDCTNHASLGSGVTLDIGFSKPGSNVGE